MRKKSIAPQPTLFVGKEEVMSAQLTACVGGYSKYIIIRHLPFSSVITTIGSLSFPSPFTVNAKT